jgi:NAD(P)-dependent dehydrogenase (short-subunit alcohol dehydrogenase family)
MIRHQVMYNLMAQGGYTTQGGPEAKDATVEDALPGYSSIMAMPIPWVEVEDISGAVLYLLSDAARYLTGVELPVNGGFNRGW